MTQQRLLGKTVIVTGGSSGMGRAICEVFAREGANVAVLGRNAERLSETLNVLPTKHGNKHCIIQADVSSAEDAKRSFREAEDKLGKKVDILINNAGIFRTVYLDEVEESMFDEIVDINLKGTFLMCREFLKSLDETDKSTEECCIVNNSGLGGVRGFQQYGSYSASKAGVVGLTKTIATEYQRHKVRCNAVVPGLTDTPMLRALGKRLPSYVDNIPMKRTARPEEIANVCLFMASSESSYVNGACLEVTGGMMA